VIYTTYIDDFQKQSGNPGPWCTM